MKIRTKLTVLFTIITATIVLIFASVIYYSAKENREKEFYNLLTKEAVTKANLFFNAEVSEKTLQDIYSNNREILNEVEVAIYDQQFKLHYHDAVELDFVKETPEMVRWIYEKGNMQFYQNKWQVVGLRYEFNNTHYVITAAAYDYYGYAKLDNLLQNSVILFVITILFIYIAGWFFSKKAFEPVDQMTKKVKNISATNLHLRLPSNTNKDELSELSNTFNQMLSRLENSFETQKHFVSNISHELRTPLAAIITELELSLTKERSLEHYKTAIARTLSDAQKLNRLSNSLLDLAKASYDPSEISFKQTRIDEVLLDAAQQVQKSDSTYKVIISFESNFEDDRQISVNGNEYLLKVAFANLFENGCKFSTDHQCSVLISFHQNKLRLEFLDNGIGITQENIDQIFKPFYRGDNKDFASGNGIGLSLTKKIISLHHATISVRSKSDVGSVFIVEFTTV
ncbi:ATP-binding protein [Myroides ceti]|uniref:histidine kinase n=1 Tax=Paenimyroides ceti TaxID=395087 RepID=A0ABT8CQZ9_9FLAO|nr:ATP-binding protein [Paenimyroides ceti]MDN3706775.1 ATP-binding protein [Paenimyroides ceti]